MVLTRRAKVAAVANMIPNQEVIGDLEGDLLIVSWGGTYGHTLSATRALRKEGKRVSLCHISYINPLPKNLAQIFSRFSKILVCELNLGMMANYLRMNLQQFTYNQLNKVQGQPFIVAEIVEKANELLKSK